MDERMQFVADYLKDHWAVAHLCRRYGISRKTGYKWIARYEEDGWTGIREHSRVPQSCPHLTPVALQVRLVQLRREHPHWGPRKLLHRLGTLEPGTAWPAPSTAGEILKRHGLVAKRRMRRRTSAAPQPLQTVRQPNEVWATDFKGWFRRGKTVSGPVFRILIPVRRLTKTGPDTVSASPKLIEFVIGGKLRAQAIQTLNLRGGSGEGQNG
jgi:transposase-like protein